MNASTRNSIEIWLLWYSDISVELNTVLAFANHECFIWINDTFFLFYATNEHKCSTIFYGRGIKCIKRWHTLIEQMNNKQWQVMHMQLNIGSFLAKAHWFIKYYGIYTLICMDGGHFEILQYSVRYFAPIFIFTFRKLVLGFFLEVSEKKS